MDRAQISEVVDDFIDARTEESYECSWVSSASMKDVLSTGAALDCWRLAARLLSDQPQREYGPLHAAWVPLPNGDRVMAYWRTSRPLRRSVVDVLSEAL